MPNMIPWQDFTIPGGAIARNPAGQIEGRLELAEGYTLTFLADAAGATFGWLPNEPVFEATRLEDPDDDAGDRPIGAQPDPWGWQRTAEEIPAHMILVADCQAMVAKRHPDGLGWQYVPADNWPALTEQARAEIERQGGALNLSGLYRCPPDLAELGTWELPPALVADEDM